MSTQAKLGTSLVGVLLLIILLGLAWMPFDPNAIDLDHLAGAGASPTAFNTTSGRQITPVGGPPSPSL